MGKKHALKLTASCGKNTPAHQLRFRTPANLRSSGVCTILSGSKLHLVSQQLSVAKVTVVSYAKSHGDVVDERLPHDQRGFENGEEQGMK